MLIEGSCHCGNITFSLQWEPDPNRVPARKCGCSFCTKHGGVWTSNPDGALRIRHQDPSQVSRYAMGTGTAEFHVCARCGVVPVVTSEIDGRTYSVVNVNTFVNVDPSMLDTAPADFEGESTDSRLQRRKRNWVRDVVIRERAD